MTRFQVRLFARYAELFRTGTLEVALPEGARVTELLDALRAVAGGESLPARPFVAVNMSQAAPEAVLQPGDEIALLPPLAGG